MRPWFACSLALALFACASTRTPDAPVAETSREPAVFAAMAEVGSIPAEELWPTFRPARTPVAVYDGTHTLAFHHPSPPEGFTSFSSRQGVWLFDGRHPLVTANSSVELGGVLTATVLVPTSAAVTPRELASLIVHETFHVHQRTHHPSWTANEVDLFTYPVEDAELLARRRLETFALRRALTAHAPPVRACWSRVALTFRARRYEMMDPRFATYERRSELNEGLASYIEHRVRQLPDSAALSEDSFEPDAVRERAYRTGTALALLLDRLAPTWKRELIATDTLPLDVLLGAAAALDDRTERCAFRDEQLRSARERAAHDVAKLEAERAERRDAFLETPGTRLVIVADSSPLFPQGFDPLNVQRVAPGEVLHGRYLKLGNERATIELLGRASLTRAAGAHPLFNGVRELVVTGLAAPTVDERNGVVRVTASGVTAELVGARVYREKGVVRIVTR